MRAKRECRTLAIYMYPPRFFFFFSSTHETIKQNGSWEDDHGEPPRSTRPAEQWAERPEQASSEADPEEAREPTEPAAIGPPGDGAAAPAPATGAGVTMGGTPCPEKRFPWGGKDWGGQPASQRMEDEVRDGEATWIMSLEGILVGEDGNHFFCR